MDPQLLPIEVPYFEHAILSKYWVGMTPSPHTCHQTRDALLVSQQGPPQGQISPLPKVAPYHEAVLQMGQDQSIV